VSAFKSERTYHGEIEDLTPVAADVVSHFKGQNFDVEAVHGASGTWDISIVKGKTMQAVLGLKLALKVLLVPENGVIVIHAGMGIFGRQMAPAALGLVGIRVALIGAGAAAATLIALPLLVTQAWGLVKASKLDDEAMLVVHESMLRHYADIALALGPSGGETTGALAIEGRKCAECGTVAAGTAKFCGNCGTSLT
jgi:hypothetical protein